MLLPKQANNSVNFNKGIIYIFAVITLVTIARSLVHIFAPDGGANSIATIVQFDGTPDPDAVIYNIFGLWGLAQLAMGAMYLIVLIRYRNLIPLMWIFILAEYAMRIVVGKSFGDCYDRMVILQEKGAKIGDKDLLNRISERSGLPAGGPWCRDTMLVHYNGTVHDTGVY